jgi:very-short-patch-repair endonuclease
MRNESTSRDENVAKLANRQRGVVAGYQLVELGLSRWTIMRSVSAGRLHRIHYGVYAVGHRALSMDGKLMGAVLACGPGAVLSHRHAAELWGIHKTSRREIDVTTTRNIRGRNDIAAHCVKRLDAADRTIRRSVPVTTVARTLLDLAEVVPKRRLERAIDEAERRRLFDLNQIDAVVKRNPGRRGLKPLKSVIENATEPQLTKTELEHLFVDFCEQFALPLPKFNVIVEGYEVDAAWIDRKLIVELDSWRWHSGREAFEADRERDAALQLADYRVIRVTWRRLTRDAPRLARELS